MGHSVPLTGCDEYEAETFFPMLGMSIRVVGPGEPTTIYHWETEAEGFLVLAGFGVLLLRLWKVQIEEYARYSKELPGQKTLVRRLPGVRGEIKDRYGIPLAVNVMSLEIKLHLEDGAG